MTMMGFYEPAKDPEELAGFLHSEGLEEDAALVRALARAVLAGGGLRMAPQKDSAMTDSPEMLPCPFCGERENLMVTVGPSPNLYGVICYGCGCYLDARADSEGEAVALWNRRADLRPNHAYRVGVAVGRNQAPPASVAPCSATEREELLRRLLEQVLRAEAAESRLRAADALAAAVEYEHRSLGEGNSVAETRAALAAYLAARGENAHAD